MSDRKKIEEIVRHHGYMDYKWIDPKTIVTAEWVRMKCTFGCPGYNKSASCPPNVPSVSTCRRFFDEYREALVLRFEKEVAKPEDRHAWTRKINLELIKLERDLFLLGYPKAFVLFMDTCGICPECAETRDECKDPGRMRPAPDSMAVDVFTTVRRIGYSIQVLDRYNQKMDRYAFLLIA